MQSKPRSTAIQAAQTAPSDILSVGSRTNKLSWIRAREHAIATKAPAEADPSDQRTQRLLIAGYGVRSRSSSRLLLIRYIMADLPELTPIAEWPTLTAAEVRRMTRPTNPYVAEAEARCLAGDDLIIATLKNLVEERTSAQTLQPCLSAAVTSGSEPLVHRLLSPGVPVDIESVRIAITLKALKILSLFVRYGWDIDKEVEWCHPSPLS